MSREIKFRAWNKDKGSMHYEGTRVLEVDGFNYMQWTGIKDSNNKDVWEGDIAEVVILNEFGSQRVELGKIEYQNERAAFILRSLSNPDLMTRIESVNNGRPNFKVIGNIYENTDLLKQTKC